MTLLSSKIKVWPQVKPTNWPQILERFVEKEKNVAQIKNPSGVRKSIQISQNLTNWSEGYHWNQLVELVILIPNSIFHVKVSCQSTRPIRYGNNDTLTRCKSIINKLAHMYMHERASELPLGPLRTYVVMSKVLLGFLKLVTCIFRQSCERSELGLSIQITHIWP